VTSVSVVIPVKDGGPLLQEVLDAVRRQGELELIVLDSGSIDGSRRRAVAAGAEVIDIAAGDFGHGRTRNVGAERSSGELICFLTQDAVPAAGWLDAYREAFALADRVGAAYGPHLPRPRTSPMIARELSEFFATFAPDGRPVVQRADGPVFLSNVNACYARACWSEIRFPDVPYAEDQAFARAMLEAGWAKVYHPGAAVEHAHDYGMVEFMRRYFDEYRGLRETIDHVEAISPRGVAGVTRRQVSADLRWMAERDWPAQQRARWAVRSAAHHAGRQVFAALGSRAERLPGGVQRVLSLESRGATGAGGQSIRRAMDTPVWDEVLRVSRDGQVPLADPVPGQSERERLHIAVVIPTFTKGSGGHNSIFQMMRWWERMGHTCSLWLHEADARHAYAGGGVMRRRIVEDFTDLDAPVFRGFGDWYGADVVVATGWETAHPTVLLPDCRARVYLIHDHEPEFFPTSAEALWAEQTYSLDLYPISGSVWLRDLLRDRYGKDGPWFRFGVDHEVYRRTGAERRRDTVLFYSREFTARRAVPLGMLALAELARRRPDLRVVLFGTDEEIDAAFDYELLGIVSPATLARRYNEATVGLCLSLTNYSLIPQEMMACGLPCVDLAGRSPEAAFGTDGPAELAQPDPLAIADAVERLLDDEQLWTRRSRAGLDFVADATWERAAREVEAGLRAALRERERSPAPAEPR
jgi:glycosyltransferase involved in cell wall biosynthesis/GT2 family glycosyltransferase